jgi:hypothetical protein
MVRIVDFGRSIRALAEGWRDFEGEVVLACADPLVLPRPVCIQVSGDGTGRPDLRASDDVRGNPGVPERLEGDVRAWSRLVVGHLEGSEACALHVLHASGGRAAEMAAKLFPARSPYLPAPDYF